MIAVNILNTIPKPKVIAKPLIGPLPKKNNTTAAITVVTFESRIVANALENPESIAFLKVEAYNLQVQDAERLADVEVDELKGQLPW